MDQALLEWIMPSLKNGGSATGVHWNRFREVYDDLSFADRVELAEYWDKLYSVQTHFHANRFREIFEIFSGNLKIVEFGCHQGQLAQIMLEEFPNIESWAGYDLAPPLKRNIVKNSKYTAIALKDWFHLTPLPDFDTFVSSHTFEHISGEQARKTLEHIDDKAKYLALEVPIDEDGRDWQNWGCSHVLTLGRKDLYKMILSFGYTLIYQIPKIGVSAWQK